MLKRCGPIFTGRSTSPSTKLQEPSNSFTIVELGLIVTSSIVNFTRLDFGNTLRAEPVSVRTLDKWVVLYPKIFPPIFFKICQESSSNGSRLLKGVVQSNHLLSQLKLGFWFFQGIWGFQWFNQVPCAHIHCQAPTCQVSRFTMPVCTFKKPICSTVNCKGKMVILQSKVKKFGQHLILSSQSSFDQVLIMIPQAWLKNPQDAKSYYF